MINNCKTNRWIDPAGFWDYSDLIGAEVKIKSLPVAMMNFGSLNADQIFTISDINFRVSLDGKTITVLSLTEKPELSLTFKDVEVVKICGENLSSNIFKIGDNVPISVENDERDFELYIRSVLDCTWMTKNEGTVDLYNTWHGNINTGNLKPGKYYVDMLWKKVKDDGTMEKGVIRKIKAFRLEKL